MNNFLIKTFGRLALFATLPLSAAAQETASTISETVLEEIIVTARGREENIQDVPFALTAFNKDDLKKRAISELDDVARFTAGFSFEDFDGGNGSPVIRGQSTLNRTAREQTTAVFLDGVYLPRSWLVDLGADGFERIEIAKGPQSARYGRNAFAGAVNYISEKASNELVFDISGTLGNDDREDISASISVPIVEDVFAVRASYSSSEFDGTWSNDHPNANSINGLGTRGNVGGWDNENYYLNAMITPSDALTIDLSYYGYEKIEEARASRWLNTNQGDGNCGVGGSRLFCGEFPPPADNVTVEPRGFGRQAEAGIYRAKVSYELNDIWNLSYLYGHIEGETIAAVSSESDPVDCGTILSPFIFQGFASVCNFQGTPVGNLDYDSHELRAAFASQGKLRGALGLFYGDGEDNNSAVSRNISARGTSPVAFDPLNTSFRPGGFPFDPAVFGNLVFRNETSTTEVTAIFGELGYDLSDTSRISVEARFTQEEITTVNNINGDVFSEDFDFFTPRLTYEKDLNDDSLLYASLARGAKAGGFNTGTGISPEFATFDPEFSWTLEGGSKNVLLDGRLIANFAVFYTQWEDQQINSRDPGSDNPLTTVITRNLGDLTTIGLEFEGSYLASDNLSFDASFSYVDATFDDGTRDVVIGPDSCDDIVCSSVGDVSGNEISGTPKFQAALGAQWSGDIGSYEYSLRADVAHQGSFFADTVNISEVPSRTTVNATAIFNVGDFELRFWARNLFDETYVSNSLQIFQSAPNANLLGSFFGERRTVGVTANYSFGGKE